MVQKYRRRISGRLLDRIDLHSEVPIVEYQELTSTEPVESSARSVPGSKRPAPFPESVTVTDTETNSPCPRIEGTAEEVRRADS